MNDSAAMTLDEQEWRSRRWDQVGLKVIKLKSGKWALFDMWGEFVGLAEGQFAEDFYSTIEEAFATHDFKAGFLKRQRKEEVLAVAGISLAALDL